MSENFDAHPAQVELAKVFTSVRLMGPPLGEKVVRLVAHLFSPEEAEVARHLPFYYPKPLEKIAGKAGRDPAEIKPLLGQVPAEARRVSRRVGQPAKRSSFQSALASHLPEH